MAQSQQVVPETLPGGFSQWDSTPSTSAPSSAPDVLPGNFSGFDSQNNQPGAFGRFITHALGIPEGMASNPNAYLNPFSKEYWQQAALENQQRKANPLQSVGIDPSQGANQFIPGSDIVRDAQAGNYAGAGGDLVSLISKLAMLRSMRGAKVSTPEPIPQQRPALPAAPIELGPSSITPQTQEGILPAASRITPQGKVQYLTRPLRQGETPAVAKDVNTSSQSAFIDRLQELMNRQTETESPFQAADRRMAEYAKSPYDRATAPKANASAMESPQFAYRTRDAGETGIMPLSGKAQASLDPATVQSYMEGRGVAQNHPQELVRIDLSKLDPSEYSVASNGYVKFNGPVPESFIEKMGSKAISDTTPRVPTSDADMQNLLMQSLQMVKARAGRK